MDQQTNWHQYVDALGTPRPTNGDQSNRLTRNKVLKAPGDDQLTPLPLSVARSLERLEQVLWQQSKFVSDAAHELRHPIAGLRARLEEMRLDPEPARIPDVIEEVLSDVDRLQSIVTDLLLLSRIEATTHHAANQARRPQPVDLADLVDAEIVHRHDQLANKLWLEPGVVVIGVPGELVRLLANLLDNAQRHARHQVRIEVRRIGTAAELSVSDDGDGIAEADRERIFERFVRLDAARMRDHGGNGLGLAIAREIAHAHRGTLKAGESTGGGARFVLRLPLAPQRSDGSSPPSW